MKILKYRSFRNGRNKTFLILFVQIFDLIEIMFLWFHIAIEKVPPVIMGICFPLSLLKVKPFIYS